MREVYSDIFSDNTEACFMDLLKCTQEYQNWWIKSDHYC